MGRPKRRPGQLGGRTVGWAAGRPNGRVKEWKGWQGRTEKDGNGKGPGPSGSRSVKGSFGQPLRSAKGLFRQGLGPSRVRSVTLPRSAKGRSVKVPARPGLGPSKVRSARASARRSSSPRESHPVKVRPARVSACQGFVRSPSPGQPKGRSIKVPAHPGLGPSKVRSARASARRSSSPGGSPHPSTSGSPPHLFPFPPPFMSSSSPLPLRRLLPLRRPAPPSCVPVRLSRRGRDSTAGGGIARAKMWNGISGAERRAAAASGAPLPRPPGSRPEPTPGRQTSRERGGERHPGKGKTKEQERVFEQKGPKPAKRRSGRAAKGRPVEQCRCTEMKRSSGKAVPR